MAPTTKAKGKAATTVATDTTPDNSEHSNKRSRSDDETTSDDQPSTTSKLNERMEKLKQLKRRRVNDTEQSRNQTALYSIPKCCSFYM